MKRALAYVIALVCASCGAAKTSAVIELRSDFDDAIDEVMVEIRDARDARVLSQASFARASGPSFQMPFSFGVQPQASADAFVVKATALASGRASVTGKLRVSYEPGRTVHRTLYLQSACAGTSCADGESCDPIARACRAVPDADQVGTAAADGGTPDASERDAGEPDEPAAANGGGGSSGAAGERATGTHADANSVGPSAGTAGGAGDTAPPAADGGMAGTSPAAGGVGGLGIAGRGGSSGSGRAGSPAAGSGGAPASPGGSGVPPDVGRGTLSEKQWASVMHGGRNYTVHSNVYGPGSLTLDYTGTAFTITSESGSASGGVAAPSVFIGRVYDEGMADSVLPARVSELRRVPIAFSHNADRVDGAYRVIAGAWLGTTASGDTGFASGGTLEVWPYAKPGQMPDGSVQARALSVAGAPGTWDVWIGTYADRPAVVYVSTAALSAVQLDLKPFLDDAAQRPNAIEAGWYVTSVSAGFDIYEGGAGLHIDVANISAE